jgi:hypothetical protein
MKTRIKISFRVTEIGCAPGDVTAALSLQPTRTWLKGDPVHPRTALIHKDSGWEFAEERELPEGSYYSDWVRDFVERIHPYRAALAQACGSYAAMLSCGLTLHGEERPDLFLEAAVVRKLADLGASIDVDIYHVAADPRSQPPPEASEPH